MDLETLPTLCYVTSLFNGATLNNGMLTLMLYVIDDAVTFSVALTFRYDTF